MNQVTKNLACEWAQDNIRANTVAPWVIRTSRTEGPLGVRFSLEYFFLFFSFFFWLQFSLEYCYEFYFTLVFYVVFCLSSLCNVIPLGINIFPIITGKFNSERTDTSFDL